MMKKKFRNIIAFLLSMLMITIFNLQSFSAVSSLAKTKIQQSSKEALNYLINKTKVNGMQDWDAVALAMAGYNLNSNALKIKGKTYLETKQNEILKELSYNWSTSYAKHILTITSSGYDPHNFCGINIVETLKNSQLPSGKFKDTIDGTNELYLNTHVWSIIALEAIKENYDRTNAVKFLEANQNKDGGFSWLIGNKNSDIDTTAMAVTALTMAGRTKSSGSVSKALYFLRNKIKNLPKESQSAETLAWVIQAVVSAKDDLGKYYVGKNNVLYELLAYKDKTGGFKHTKSGKVDLIATNQVVRALISFNNSKNMYSNIKYEKDKYFNNISQKNEEPIILYSAYYKDSKSLELITKSIGFEEAILLLNGEKTLINSTSKDGLFKFSKNIDLKTLDYKLILKNKGNVAKIVSGIFEPVEKGYNVKVRIEGPDKNLIGTYNVKTGNKVVYDFNGQKFTTEIPSAYAAVAKALIDNNIPFEVDYKYGPYINSIGNISSGYFKGWDGWMYFINFKDPGVGMSTCEIKDNDNILVYYGDWGIKPLQIQVPDQVQKNTKFEIKVLSEGIPVGEAKVFVGDKTYTTNQDGIAEVIIESPGKYKIFAEKNKDGKPEYIRSEGIEIEVK